MSSNKALQFRLEKQEELLEKYESTLENMQIAFLKELNKIKKDVQLNCNEAALVRIKYLEKEIKQDLIGREFEIWN